jgi:hypothetical protein
MYINMRGVELSVTIYCCGTNWRCQFNCRVISASRAIAAERGAERNTLPPRLPQTGFGVRASFGHAVIAIQRHGAQWPRAGRRAFAPASSIRQGASEGSNDLSGGRSAERCGRYRVRWQCQRNHDKLILEPLDRPDRAATVPGPPRKRVRARSVEKTQWMTRQSENLEKHP